MALISKRPLFQGALFTKNDEPAIKLFVAVCFTHKVA
jgi:hypothetical protein